VRCATQNTLLGKSKEWDLTSIWIITLVSDPQVGNSVWDKYCIHLRRPNLWAGSNTCALTFCMLIEFKSVDKF
jgi:hypothetical protein